MSDCDCGTCSWCWGRRSTRKEASPYLDEKSPLGTTDQIEAQMNGYLPSPSGGLPPQAGCPHLSTNAINGAPRMDKRTPMLSQPDRDGEFPYANTAPTGGQGNGGRRSMQEIWRTIRHIPRRMLSSLTANHPNDTSPSPPVRQSWLRRFFRGMDMRK